jgi:hypothetical protein
VTKKSSIYLNLPRPLKVNPSPLYYAPLVIGTNHLRKVTHWLGIIPPANNPPANNPPANNPTIALIRTKEYTAVNRLLEQSHLTDDNWYNWKERMNRVFTNCDITGYIDGTIL